MSEPLRVPVKYGLINPELLEPKHNEHVWVAISVFKVSRKSLLSNKASVFLDNENLASLQVGCYVCEEPYAERMLYRKCPGDPRDRKGG